MQVIYEAENLRYETPGAAAIDLRYHGMEKFSLYPGELRTVGTGLKMTLPPSTCALIIPRSGSGRKGLVLGNGVGLIDMDYRGEIMLTLLNRSTYPIDIIPGERVAQMIFTVVIRPTFEYVSEFTSVTERGENGFGSTGVT